MLTAAVRDLHACYPGEFITDVRTSCSPLWENNPYLTPLDETDPEVEVLECSYPLINVCNQLPYHNIHGFISFLNEKLGLSIRPTRFHGDLHLSPQEKAWYSQVHELAGIDLPYWIIAGGGKYDLTIKWWSSERYQEVVDYFRGKIQFVQIGARGHFHPRLKGTIDLRGNTDLRQLVRLVYHSQGALCGVTALMHLAAAVETKRGNPPSRPCVVVAGGREPAHWEAYPGHQFIALNGALPCCANGGCWRSRTLPLGDGDFRDDPENRCVDVVGDLPRCMDMISAKEVIRRIQLYLDGGAAKPLTSPERAAAKKAVRVSEKNAYDETALTMHNARIELERFIRAIPAPPFEFQGRGIIICGGGARYFTNAWVCIHMLRRHGCSLPIELWHLDGEMDPEMEALVAPLGVQCVDAEKMRQKHPVRRLGGWQSKPYAILYSRFAEVLFLDADNVPVVNPEFLFEAEQYQKTGALFWPDLPIAERDVAIWESCGLSQPEREFESGQIVVDKRRCWAAMRLALWFNEHSDFYYTYIYGDKETFHLAFHKLKKAYGFIPTPVHWFPGAMCQHDLSGQRIFQHRNTDKWNLFLHNKRLPDFWWEAECLEYVRDLRERWDGRLSQFPNPSSLRLQKPRSRRSKEVHFSAVMISCASREPVRAQTLQSLSESDWGTRPVLLQMDQSSHESPEVRQLENARQALEAAASLDGEYILFLEDDLTFNRFIWHNLQNWTPLRNRAAVLGSIYNPGISPAACNWRENYFLAKSVSCFGSQALVIARPALPFILEHWDKIRGKQDIRISRLAGQLQPQLYYHAPSLAQHVGKESTWGGFFHKAGDFDREWKAPVL